MLSRKAGSKLFSFCLLTLLILSDTNSAVAADSEWAGSESCVECHEDRHASWQKTYHRTMTQEATAETVLGRFDGQSLSYWGGVIRPLKRNGRFFFEYYSADGANKLAEYEILRTVGSHRYQQYLTQVEGAAGTYYRLHLLWHMGEQRWVHMNGAFLGPDNQAFDAQVSVWNHNCIFCHNTGPRPNILNLADLNQRAAAGQAVDSATQAIYDSEVAELGISCETCHGPAAAHIAANQNPLRRLWHELSGSDDTIIHPLALDQERSVQICGQCHGQRVAKDVTEVQRWIHDGPSYRAGDDLFASVNLVTPQTQIPGDSVADRFERRFWKDGTPRLTAYEYQGLLMSACYEGGEITCNTCHTMHEGDPAGMLTEENRGDASCLGCHQQFAENITAHTHHPAESEASRCNSCHMPRIVYGVMAIHRSHRIEVPEPAANTMAGRPNACNQCHLDRSPQWAANQRRQLWGGIKEQTVQRDDQAPVQLPDGIASVYAGDPVQRALAAEAVGYAAERGWLRVSHWAPHLITAMTDNYPAIRRFARNSFIQINRYQWRDSDLDRNLAGFDFIASKTQRNQSLAALLQRWRALTAEFPQAAPAAMVLTPDYLPNETVDDLQALGARRSGEISIGE